jgi:hypothetical protein
MVRACRVQSAHARDHIFATLDAKRKTSAPKFHSRNTTF